MGKISNASLASRIQNAKDMIAIIKLMLNYSPVLNLDSTAEMDILIDKITVSNDGVINAVNAYNSFVQQRRAAYNTDAYSVSKLVSPIRNSIKAQYGKNSIEYSQIDTVLKKLQGAKPTVVAATDTTDAQSISNTERSYGALLQNFSNLVQTLKSFTGYTPVAAHLETAALTTQVASLNALNTNVAANLFKLTTARNLRDTNYEDLKTRCQRIKSYVSATYGTQSNEYARIKGYSI